MSEVQNDAKDKGVGVLHHDYTAGSTKQFSESYDHSSESRDNLQKR